MGPETKVWEDTWLVAVPYRRKKLTKGGDRGPKKEWMCDADNIEQNKAIVLYPASVLFKSLPAPI